MAQGSRPQYPEVTRVVTMVRWIPPVLIVGGLAYDLFTPEQYHPFPFFATAPLVAAPFYSRYGTVLTSVVAFAAVAVGHLRFGHVTAPETVAEVIATAFIVVLALFVNRVMWLGGRRLEVARETAAALQRAVLPTPEKLIGGLETAVRYEAAQEEASIGGDLYVVQDTPYGVRFIIGDVRGKGLSAITAVANTAAAFREAVEFEPDLRRAGRRMEVSMKRELYRYTGTTQAEGFVTAVLAEVPPGREMLRLVNRGHPAPLLLHGDGTVRLLQSGTGTFALPLGLGELAPGGDEATEYGFPPGATLLMYTDGLSEARDRDGVFYDPAARLAGQTFPTAESLLSTVVDDVRHHTGGATTDDMALLAVRHTEDCDHRHHR